MIYFQSLTRKDLEEQLYPLCRPRKPVGKSEEEIEEQRRKQARYRAKQIFQWVYQRFIDDWDQMTDVSKDTRAWLKENVQILRLNAHTSSQSLDGTKKFLWKLDDAKTIESVIIPAALQEKETVDDEDLPKGSALHDGIRTGEVLHPLVQAAPRFTGRPADASVDSEKWGRLTACISSQVGCAMACKFCLTGIQGLDRHLQTQEIVTQVYELRRVAPITNIVFMGMGEPLHNVENVIRACEILLDEFGMNFSKRKVTVSTSGLVPAIEELGKRIDVSLAVSLNATTDEQRTEIMPVNKRWNISALMKTLREFPLASHRRITFEYVMLKDFNDSLEDARRLIGLVRGIPSKVNLIPFNEHPGSDYKRPSDETVRVFQKFLLDRGVTTTVRISRGRDVLAACGQLRSIFGTARGTEKHRDYANPTSA